MNVQENPPPYQCPQGSTEDKKPFRWMRGIHAGLHKGTVEDFLADCHADKERELAIEKRQEEERTRRHVNTTLSS